MAEFYSVQKGALNHPLLGTLVKGECLLASNQE